MSSEKKRLPPYISYRTFKNFVGRLEQQIPARIDRSYWGETLSGSTGIQLMAALRFLGLIDNSGKPSGQLKQLASARGDQQAVVLAQIAAQSYGFILKSSLDTQSATYAQLEECFHDGFQLTPDVCRKCIKFFVSLAADGKIPLSNFMTKRFRWAHASTGTTETKSTAKKVRRKINQNLAVPQNFEEVPDKDIMSWNSMLLVKFPTFDPSWSDEVKLKWFTAFDELLKRHPTLLTKD